MPRTIIGLTSHVPPDNSVIVYPKIKMLFSKMLANSGIIDRQSLDRYVANQALPPEPTEIDVSNPSSDGAFRVVSADDLDFGVQSECRLFVPDVVCRDTILSVAQLNLRNSRRVEFTNCIITGDVSISMTEFPLQTVYLDGCLVLGKVIVYGIGNPQAETHITRLNCCRLTLQNLQIGSVQIDMCRLPALYLTDSHVQRLIIRSNVIENARLYHTTVHSADVDHAQFNLSKIGEKPTDCAALKSSSDLFKIIDDFAWGDTSKEDLFETLEFLKKHTALSSDRRSFNVVRQIEATLYQKSRAARWTMWMLGAMQRPIVPFLFAFCVLLVAALFYWLCPLKFLQNGTLVTSLSPADACYFSGVTMMTVGYGDIVPLGLARWLAIFESMFGVSLWALYIVALTRKYVDCVKHGGQLRVCATPAVCKIFALRHNPRVQLRAAV